MQNQISKLQVYQAAKTSTGLLEENNILTMYNTKPFEMNAIVTAAVAQYNGKTIFDQLTDGIGNIASVEVNNREVQWELYLRQDNSYPVTKSVEECNGGITTGVGSQGQPFKVGFDHQFTKNDIIIPEDERFRLIVSEIPYNDGNNWITTFRLFDPNIVSFPTDEASLGKRFTRTATQVAEYSDKGGNTDMSRPVKLRNCLNTLRLSYSVTRTAATNAMVVEMMTKSGKSVKYWTDLAEWNAMEQWKRDLAFTHIESVYNQGINLSNIIKDGGRPIYSGAGLQDQISPSNTFSHNGGITYRQIQNWVETLSSQCTQYGTDSNLTLFAGSGLFELITNAVILETRGSSFSNIIQDGVQFLTGKGDAIEYTQPQFKTINFLNGNSLNIVRFDAFSDSNYYKKQFRGKTRKSFEGIFMNLGKSSTGGSNLTKVYKKGSDSISWYVPGSYTPTGAVKGMSASGKDGYDRHWLTEEGLIMKDPTGSGRVLLSA